jgi:hypothetical protein
MQPNTLKLSERFEHLLTKLPETGMGYQIVKVILKSGEVLHQHKVINAKFLMLEANEHISVKDIEHIELEKRN